MGDGACHEFGTRGPSSAKPREGGGGDGMGVWEMQFNKAAFFGFSSLHSRKDRLLSRPWRLQTTATFCVSQNYPIIRVYSPSPFLRSVSLRSYYPCISSEWFDYSETRARRRGASRSTQHLGCARQVRPGGGGGAMVFSVVLRETFMATYTNGNGRAAV